MEPAWIEPCIPTLVKTPPIGADWLHEINGYCAISVIDRGRAKIFTRRGHDWSARMPNIKAALERLKVKSAVIDGEVIMTDKDGVADFFALHLALARKSAPGATLIAFDVLELHGEDLRLCRSRSAGRASKGFCASPVPRCSSARPPMSRSVELDPLMCWITTDQSQSLA